MGMTSEMTGPLPVRRFNPAIELEQQLRNNIYDAMQGASVEELIRLALPSDSGTYFRSVMEGHSLKVEKPLLTHLYDLFQEVKDALCFSATVDFYVTGNGNVNAFSVAIENDDKPSIVNVNSALLSLMTDQEVKFVLGHELGHLINHDSKMNSILNFVFPKEEDVPLVLQHKVRLWSQLAELEADRYGYLACGDLYSCVSAFYKMSSGLDITKMNVQLDALLEENRRHLDYFLTDKGISVDTHPVNPIRVESLNLYASSETGEDLTNGMDNLISILLKVGCSEIDKPLSDFIASAGLIVTNLDGEMSEAEFETVIEMLSSQQIFAKEYLKQLGQQDVPKIFNESIEAIMATEPGLRDGMLIYVIDLVLSDHELSRTEMDFIFELGEKAFGYSKKECATFIAQRMQANFTPDPTKFP